MSAGHPNADDSAARGDGRDVMDDPRVLALLEDYQRELGAGRNPDRQAFINRYPDLSSAVAECLDGLELLHQGMPTRVGGNQSSAEHHRSTIATIGRLANPLGDFQIVREIARGGMGIVYEAVQLSLGRRVALKVLPFAATFDGRQLQRFKNEAQAAALLHHTHIVPIYAVGCERGVHFYAMQLIEGQSLALVIRQLREKEGRKTAHDEQAGHLPITTDEDHTLQWPAANIAAKSVADTATAAARDNSTIDVSTVVTAGSSFASEAYVRRAAQLAIQAAEALEHAHQIGVVHRDIKPANLLIDATGNLWVTDFGLAQLHTDQNLTKSGDFLGTLRYMSPEQVGGQRVELDHRTDIYALGATFYELLTLEPVFAGQSHQELLYQILHEEPRSLRGINRSISPELETIVLKALNKSAADRYRTAAEFAADVRRYLKHEPILARRPSLTDRIRKWSRRHPGAVIAAIVLLIVVAAGSLISNRLISLEQDRTADALRREKARANEAEYRFQQAREAVDELFSVSEEDLVNKPETSSTRRRILEIVRNFYQDFVAQREGDPDAQRELQAAQERAATILNELNTLRQDLNVGLLAKRAVQDELALTDAQKSQLEAAMVSRTGEPRPPFGQPRGGRGEDPRKRVALAQERVNLVDQVLTESQQKRFKQIGWQWQMIGAFREPEVISVLSLTAPQRTKIGEIEREVFGRPGGRGGPDFGPGRGPPHGGEGFDHGPPNGPRPFGSPNDGFEDRPPPDGRHPDGPHRPPDRQSMQNAMNKALAVLTDDQLQSWRELTGPTFTGLEDEPFPGPPPGGPPR